MKRGRTFFSNPIDTVSWFFSKQGGKEASLSPPSGPAPLLSDEGAREKREEGDRFLCVCIRVRRQKRWFLQTLDAPRQIPRLQDPFCVSRGLKATPFLGDTCARILTLWLLLFPSAISRQKQERFSMRSPGFSSLWSSYMHAINACRTENS